MGVYPTKCPKCWGRGVTFRIHCTQCGEDMKSCRCPSPSPSSEPRRVTCPVCKGEGSLMVRK